MSILSLTNNIVNEIETKVTPENIRAGVVTFKGVVGNVLPKDTDGFLFKYDKDIWNSWTPPATSAVKFTPAFFNLITSLDNLDMTGMYNLSYMLYNCHQLEKVSIVNMEPNVNLANAFANCDTLTNIDFMFNLNDIHPINVVNMFMNTKLENYPTILLDATNSVSGMFYQCSMMKNSPELDTSNIKIMSSMFYQCSNLVNVCNYDTSNVTSMGSMFYGCSKLTNIPNFNTVNVTNMGGMFGDCENLTDLPDFDTSNVYTIRDTFTRCNSLNFPLNWNLLNVKEITNAFVSSNITEVPNLKLNYEKIENAYRAFSHCYNLLNADLDLMNVANLDALFFVCNSIENIHINVSNKCTTMKNTFTNCTMVERINISGNTSGIMHTDYLFAQCYNLKYLDLGEEIRLTTGTIQGSTCHSTFSGCSNLICVNGIINCTNARTPGTYNPTVFGGMNLRNIEEIRFLNFPGDENVSFRHSQNMSKASIDYLVDNIRVYTSGTHVLNMNSVALSRYNEEELAELTSKLTTAGWTLNAYTVQ